MARIPDEQIERLKSDVSLVRLVEAFGVELKKHGKDWLGRCPFHDDKTPSLIVSPASNLWHCLGACQVGGSVIDWVMKTQGLSFRHAVELLKADQLPALAADRPPVKASTLRHLETPLPQDADDRAALARVVDFYHDTLKQSPEALDYLAQRGLNHPELIETFRLGYANRTLAYRLPAKNRVAGAEVRAQLQRVGLLRESGHEHFNGSLVVPVLGEHGEVLEVYGRKLRDDLRPGTPKHLYLPGPHAGVWNWPALKASPEIILCESLIDAMSFWCAGYRNVTAAYGVEGFTPEHLAAFQRFGTKRVLIAYDRDAAGDSAAAKLAETLTAAGIECFRILFPKGMDANEYALKVQPASQSLGLVIRKAQWLGKGQAPERQVDLEELIQESVPHNPAPVLAAVPAAESPAAIPPEYAPAQPLPASPVPAMTPLAVPAEAVGEDLWLSLETRRYRVRGLAARGGETLKINLLVQSGEAFHVDSLDLYSARQRLAYQKQAALELSVSEELIKADLGKLLITLELRLEEQRQAAVAAAKPTAPLSEAERRAALALLKAPDLPARILSDLAACGVVGEDSNKLVGYLACVSRKLDKPLAVIIQSSSAAGKSALMDAVLQLMPEEERVQYSALTGQALFYLGETNLQHKILAIAEEEGAERASYALKLLQSDGELTIASTGKDATTGNLVTQAYRVQGPVMLFLTTTAIDIDEELLNRCLVLTVNESRAQTAAIHALQRARQTLAGLLADEDRKAVIAVHRNAQRLLRPLLVANPYAEQLTFLDDRPRTRRDHMKYLTLIRAIALLHQYQREVKTVAHRGQVLEYIEVEPADIALANRLAHEVLGRSLDELPPQTRKLLQLTHAWATGECRRLNLSQGEFRFSRKELRAATGWGDTQLKIHLARLAELEYLSLHRRGLAHDYTLSYDGQGAQGEPFLVGLVDVASLNYDRQRSGLGAERSGSGRPLVGGRSGLGRGEQIAAIPEENRLFPVLAADPAPNALLPPKSNGQSYRSISELG